MNELTNLYLAHQGKVSDKWSSYLTAYDRLFDEQRDKPVRLLEIGIQNGGSLEIWSSYFRNASALIGCDINPDCAGLSYDDPRIGVIVGDANDPEVSERLFQRTPQLDIIIDDGSHRSSDIIKSFALYFPRLVEGGVYVAEDLHCSYWADFEGGLLYPYSSISFFKRLADVINYEHWGVAKDRSDVLRGIFTRYGCEIKDEVLSQVHSIEFINSLCVVRKASPASNNLSRRVIAGSMELVFPDMRKLNDSLPPVCDQSNNPWAVRNPPPDEAIENTELLLADAQQQIVGHNQAVSERDGQIASLQQSLLEREHAFTQQLAAWQADEQQHLSEIQQAHEERDVQQRQEIADLQQRVEAQRTQAQEREEQLRQQSAQQVQALEAAAAMHAEQLQGQVMALQHDLLERERAFTQQWTTWQAEEQQRRSDTQQAHAAREEQQRQVIVNLQQQLESQRAQAQEREDQLSQHAAQQVQALQSAAAMQAEQLQGQVIVLQHDLLERERAFTQQWTTWRAEEQQRVSETQLAHETSEEQQRQEIADLHRQLESQNAQAQGREDQLSQQAEHLREQIADLQQGLLERERAFTQQWAAWRTEEQQRVSETQQTHAAREAQLREDARAQIDTLRASLNHHTAYGQALAERMAALQSTWWWRMSIPWRRSSKWPAIASSVLPPTHSETPQLQATASAPTSGVPPTTPEKRG